jgi:hypothetical protein
VVYRDTHSSGRTFGPNPHNDDHGRRYNSAFHPERSTIPWSFVVDLAWKDQRPVSSARDRVQEEGNDWAVVGPTTGRPALAERLGGGGAEREREERQNSLHRTSSILSLPRPTDRVSFNAGTDTEPPSSPSTPPPGGKFNSPEGEGGGGMDSVPKMWRVTGRPLGLD